MKIVSPFVSHKVCIRYIFSTFCFPVVSFLCDLFWYFVYLLCYNLFTFTRNLQLEFFLSFLSFLRIKNGTFREVKYLSKCSLKIAICNSIFNHWDSLSPTTSHLFTNVLTSLHTAQMINIVKTTNWNEKSTQSILIWLCLMYEFFFPINCLLDEFRSPWGKYK